jgi:hypothetical protein
MTIRPGTEWGVPVARPADLLVCDGDAALAERVGAGEERPLAIGRGDLARTVGSPGPRTTLQRVPVDAVWVEIDGRRVLAVAHVVARRRWWRGRIVAVCNAEHIGAWDVAPRSHPNDGVADVIEVDASMPWRARLQAHRRLPAGMHVPHPDISTRRITDAEWELEAGMRVHVDGIDRGGARHLRVHVEPDAFELHV